MPTTTTLFQFIKFVAVGLIGLMILLVGTAVLTEYAGLWYFWAFLITAVCNWTFLFLAHTFFTFSGHKKGGYGGKYTVFMGTYAISFFINIALVYTFTTLAYIPYFISIAGAAAITTVLTFTVNKLFIFTYDNQH